MKPRIALVTILTNNVPVLIQFYRDVIGFQVKSAPDDYAEFECDGVRFAVCSRSIMQTATNHPSYAEAPRGHSFELAFPLDSPDVVDQTFADIVAKGATPIKPPENMPWGQRTAFFADPDGNIHELFADFSS